MCTGAGKRAGANSKPVRSQSIHAWTEEQAGKRKCANADAVRGWRVHTADNTPSSNAATRSKHCNFMCQDVCVTRSMQSKPSNTQESKQQSTQQSTSAIRHNIPTHRYTPSRMKSTYTRHTYARTRLHAPGQQAGGHLVPAHTERHNPPKMLMQQ